MWLPETGRCLGGATGEGPGAAGRGWRDAVPGKRSRLPLRKVERGVAFPAPPMYASLRSGPVAALPASVPPVILGARSSGGGRGRVPREGRRPGGAGTSGRGGSVWQVSAAAHAGDSHPGGCSPEPTPAARFRCSRGCRFLACPSPAFCWPPVQVPLPAPRAAVVDPAALARNSPCFSGSLAPASSLVSRSRCLSRSARFVRLQPSFCFLLKLLGAGKVI